MTRASRSGIGRMIAAVIVVIIIAIAAGVGVFLSSRGSSTTSTTTSSVVETSSSMVSSTTSTSSTISSANGSTSTSSSTTSSIVIPLGCVFAPPTLEVNSTITPPTFTGCLISGASGQYLLAVNDVNGIELTGSFHSQFPVSVTIAPAQIGNLNSTANIAFSDNDTTVDGFHSIYLIGSHGWAINVVNQSGQNNTVTLTIPIFDAAAYAGAGG